MWTEHTVQLRLAMKFWPDGGILWNMGYGTLSTWSSILQHFVQYLSRYLTQNWKCQPHSGSVLLTNISWIYPLETTNNMFKIWQQSTPIYIYNIQIHVCVWKWWTNHQRGIAIYRAAILARLIKDKSLWISYKPFINQKQINKKTKKSDRIVA